MVLKNWKIERTHQVRLNIKILISDVKCDNSKTLHAYEISAFEAVVSAIPENLFEHKRFY